MGSGPGQDQEFPCCRVVLSCRRCLNNHQNAKTEIDDESYRDKRLGINSDGKLHGFSLRIFSKNMKQVVLFEKVIFPRKNMPVLGQKYKTGV